MKKRILSILLLAAMLSAVSCGGNTPTDTTGNTNTTETTVSADQTGDTSLDDNLPEANYEGYNFRIYLPTVNMKFYDVDEAQAEVVSNSIYERNLTVEERFNVTISAVSSGYDTVWDQTDAVVGNILAGDDFCDLMELHCIKGANLSLENALVNLRSLDYLNFDKPWWFPQTVEEMTFLDKMYLACNAISYQAIEQVGVTYINLDLYEEFNLDDTYGNVYDIVREGKWTIDKMMALAKDVYRDENGNGKKDAGDIFGYYANYTCENFWTAFDAPILEKGENSLKVVADNEKVVDIVDKMYRFFYESESTWIDEITDWSLMGFGKMFADEEVLMISMYLKLAGNELLRDADFHFGLLPSPKYDEQQENYRSFSEGTYLAIPNMGLDLDRTAVILEALTAEGYKQIVPAYQEIALKNKYLRDEDSAEMFDLIVNSYTASFAFDYDNWEGFGTLFSKLFSFDGGSRDVTSYIKSQMAAAEARAKVVYKGFSTND